MIAEEPVQPQPVEPPNPVPQPAPVKPATDKAAENNPPLPPRLASFLDFVPDKEIFAPIGSPSYPIIENFASPVANALAEQVANESVFLPGAGPRSIGVTPPPSDVPRVRSGHLIFHPTLLIEDYLDDNFFGTAADRRHSWLRNYNPGFTLNYHPNDRVNLDAFYNFTEHDFDTAVEHDYFDESAGYSVQLHHLGVEGLTFSSSDTYNQYGNTILNPLANEFDISNLEFVTGTRYETNSFNSGFQYTAGPTRVEVGYSNDLTHYFNIARVPDDSIVHTANVRGTYSLTPDHCSLFAEYSFSHGDFPDREQHDFDLQKAAVGMYGKFESLTYRVRTGVHILDEQPVPGPFIRPALSADMNYVYSRRFDITGFANRELDIGVLTGRRLTDAYGAVATVRPMLRGRLTLSHDWQAIERIMGRDRVMTSSVDYRHTILGFMEPHVGVKFTAEQPLRTQFLTESAGMRFRISQRSNAFADYYHENRKGADFNRTTDRVSSGFGHRINHFAAGSVSYDHAHRIDSRLAGAIEINELHISFQFAW